MYDSLVTPIIDYGSAIWGYKSYNALDKVQNRATRYFTGVHKFAPTLGHVGDMGWVSNRGRWKINILRLWNRLVLLDDSRLTKKIFKWDLLEHQSHNKTNFCAQAKQVLCELDKKEIYQKTDPIDLNWVKQKTLEKEKDQWSNDVTKFSKLDLLVKIKPAFGTENYLTIDIDRYDKSLLSQYRYGILPLELETGRYKGVERENRLCTLCSEGVVEDQIHFAFKCPSYNHFRREFFDICNDRIGGWDNMSDLDRTAVLFENQPRLFGKFVKKCFLHRKSLLFK